MSRRLRYQVAVSLDASSPGRLRCRRLLTDPSSGGTSWRPYRQRRAARSRGSAEKRSRVETSGCTAAASSFASFSTPGSWTRWRSPSFRCSSEPGFRSLRQAPPRSSSWRIRRRCRRAASLRWRTRYREASVPLPAFDTSRPPGNGRSTERPPPRRASRRRPGSGPPGNGPRGSERDRQRRPVGPSSPDRFSCRLSRLCRDARESRRAP